jgi:hypothetical protein
MEQSTTILCIYPNMCLFYEIIIGEERFVYPFYEEINSDCSSNISELLKTKVNMNIL